MRKRIIEVSGVHTEFRNGKRVNYAVNGGEYVIHSGEIVGLAGESGCGKSVLQHTVFRLLPENGDVISYGNAWYDGHNLLDEDSGKGFLDSVRGNRIAMVFQNPGASLNPVIPVGEQIAETIREHLKMSAEDAKARAIEMMKKVRIPNARHRYYDYPHQFSGGMCQRIMIAIAISCNPEIVIADEITTALDVTTQAQILELLRGIVREMNMALLIISHNLGLVAHYAERIYIMYGGQMVEWGSSEQIFRRPAHAYTAALLKAIPGFRQSREQKLATIEGLPPSAHTPPKGCAFYPRCTQRRPECGCDREFEMHEVEDGHFTRCICRELTDDRNYEKVIRPDWTRGNVLLDIRNISKTYVAKAGFLGRRIKEVSALSNVSLQIHEGEALGLVGESGCGKSTLAKSILGLTVPTGGNIWYNGKDLTAMSRKHRQEMQKEIQLIFQDSGSSFDPRQAIGDIIGEPLLVHGSALNRQEYDREVENLLSLVKLDAELKGRRPHELSGGQQQRVGIARALACKPKILICDEPLSALDASVQAQVMNLFLELKYKLGLAYLFISHDLSAVRYMCDNIAVMYRGHIVEYGSWEQMNQTPVHPYTKALLAAAYVRNAGKRDACMMDGIAFSRNEDDEKVDLTGCPYCPYCSDRGEECTRAIPELHEIEDGHLVACYDAERRARDLGKLLF